MKSLKSIAKYFSAGEILLWSLSVACIVASFCVFDRTNYFTLAASLIGVTSLIFNAKGNSIGQVLMIVFSLLLRVHFVCFCLLRRNADVRLYDDVHGGFCSRFLAEKP